MKKLSDYFRDFLEYLDVEKGLSLKTQETYSRLLEKFFDFLKQKNLENIKPSQLTEKEIFEYRIFLSRKLNQKKQNLKKTTQNLYLIVLRNFLKFLVEKGIETFPPEKVKLIKIKEGEKMVKFLTLEQVKKILEAPDTSNIVGLRDRAILEVLFSTGLRVGELINLNVTDVKIDKKTKDLEIVVVGKGKRLRPVYLSQRAVKWLREYLEKRNDKEKALFISYRGRKKEDRRLSIRSVENIVKKYAILAGLPFFVVPHTLRHSFATDLLSKGVDLREIQEFLGHKNISTTQIYAHLTSKKLREIHKKFHGFKK
jgi:site-specific recombinase XerD